MPDLKVKVSADDSQFQATMRRITASAGGAARSIGAGFAAAGSKLATIGAIGGALGGAGLVRGIKGITDMSGELSDLSDSTGASIRNLVVLQKRFTDAGLKADDAGKAIGRMQKFLEEAEGDPSKRGRLQELGLSLTELRRLKPEDQLEAIGEAINAIEKDSAKTAASMEIFGKAGAKLRAVFAGGKLFGNVSPELAKQAAAMESAAAKLDSVGDKLTGPASPFNRFSTGVASVVAPAMESVAEKFDKLDMVGTGQRFALSIIQASTALLQGSNAAITGAKELKKDMKEVLSWLPTIQRVNAVGNIGVTATSRATGSAAVGAAISGIRASEAASSVLTSGVIRDIVSASMSNMGVGKGVGNLVRSLTGKETPAEPEALWRRAIVGAAMGGRKTPGLWMGAEAGAPMMGAEALPSAGHVGVSGPAYRPTVGAEADRGAKTKLPQPGRWVGADAAARSRRRGAAWDGISHAPTAFLGLGSPSWRGTWATHNAAMGERSTAFFNRMSGINTDLAGATASSRFTPGGFWGDATFRDGSSTTATGTMGKSLTGVGVDTAEAARQQRKAFFEEEKFATPRASPMELNARVNARMQAQKDNAFDDAYRARNTKPGSEPAVKGPATEKGQMDLVKEMQRFNMQLEELKKGLE